MYKIFYPESSIHKVNNTIQEIYIDNYKKINYKTNRLKKVISDLIKINFFCRIDEKLTEKCLIYIKSEEIEKKKILKKILLEFDNISFLLERFLQLGNLDQSFIETNMNFSKRKWTRYSVELYLRKLKTWLIFSGLIYKKDRKYIHYNKKENLDKFLN